MNANHDIIERIQTFCRLNEVAESTFGRLAVNDGKLVSRLRSGRTVTIAKLEEIERFLAAGTSARPNKKFVEPAHE